MQMYNGRHFGLFAGTVCANRFTTSNLPGRRTNSTCPSGQQPTHATGGMWRKRTYLSRDQGRGTPRTLVGHAGNRIGHHRRAFTASRR